MRKYSFSYLTQRSFHSLVRNGFMTIASVLILSSCLLVTGCFGLLIYNLYVNLNELDGLNEIVCMCDYDLPDGEEKRIEETIKGLNNVESITFVSKEEAFEEQKKQYASFPAILDYFENKDDEKDEVTETLPPATEAPETIEPDSDFDGKAIVSDAIAKRENYKSYTYTSSVIMKILGNDVKIDGVEKYIANDDGIQFFMESFLSDQLADAKYYKDGVFYMIGETPCCGSMTVDEFSSLDYKELRKLSWLADFSNYIVTETDGGYNVTMNDVLPETVINAFDLSSVIPEGETPTVSGRATVFVNENGDITSESFDLQISVLTEGEPFVIEISYDSEISDIDSLDAIDFDVEAMAEYEQIDDIMSVIPAEAFRNEEETSDVATDTQISTDDITEETLEGETEDGQTDSETANGVIVGTQGDDTSSSSGTYIDKNPLSDAFKVVYKDINGITELRDRISAIDGIRSVKDAADAAQTLQNLKDTIMVIFIGFMIVLVFISLVIIMNTVSIAISTREKEILVMRYVGATSFFISFPFVLESILIGVISTAVAYAIQYLIYGYLCNIMMSSGQEISTFLSIAPFSEIWLPTLIGYLIIALLTCIIGSKISLARNVKV